MHKIIVIRPTGSKFNVSPEPSPAIFATGLHGLDSWKEGLCKAAQKYEFFCKILSNGCRSAVTKIERQATGCDPADILRNTFDNAAHGDICGTGNMWCSHYIILKNQIIGIRRFFPKNIEAGPGNLTGSKCISKGIVINQAAS